MCTLTRKLAKRRRIERKEKMVVATAVPTAMRLIFLDDQPPASFLLLYNVVLLAGYCHSN